MKIFKILKRDYFIFFMMFIILNALLVIRYKIENFSYKQIIDRFFISFDGILIYLPLIIFPWLVTFIMRITVFKNQGYHALLVFKLFIILVVSFLIGSLALYIYVIENLGI